MTMERIENRLLEIRRKRKVFNWHSFRHKSLTSCLMGASLAFLICGCTVQDRKNGQAESVHLQTPLGGLDVRTNAVHGPDVGLPVYPGATETGRHGDDSGSADIHVNFGNWHLNVKAIEYRSDDPEDKIVAFYKKAMASYGDVLTCKDKAAIGEPTKTNQGLTCASDHEYDLNVKVDRSSKPATVQTPHVTGNIKLLAGSTENQHIVEFSPDSNGTKFSIVVVQLPHKNETD